MNTPLYSIITPVFNRNDCIGQCIESVLINIRNSSDTEHIIVDDGSDDGTAEIVLAHAKRHPHIRIIQFTENRGTNAARNAAITAARGQWCIILDSDDYFVSDALSIVRNTMENRPGYLYYMFAPDDMQPVYERNNALKGIREKELNYTDFLGGRINGDFIHVCRTSILINHPFDERIRIHEGVFFLMFFRDAQRMWFTNTVITHRERNRTDSVTRETIRTSPKIIERTITANEILLNEFESDLKSMGFTERLRKLQLGLADNYLLLGRYNNAREILRRMQKTANRKEFMLQFICSLHLGIFYRMSLKLFLILKYKLLKHPLKG